MILLLIGLLGMQSADAPTLMDYRLYLGERHFDPLLEQPRRLVTAKADQEAYFLIQYHGPADVDRIKSMRAQGLEPIRYIYPHTYVVWGRRDALQGFERSSNARWSGDFLPEYKLLASRLNGRAPDAPTRVAVHGDIPDRTVRAALTAAGARVMDMADLDKKLRIYLIMGDGGVLQAVSELGFVYTVQPVPQDGGTRAEASAQVLAGNMNASGQPIPGYLTWLNGVGYDGSGVLVAVVDSGSLDDHPDYDPRLNPCFGVSCDENEARATSHGTHVMGIVGGDGASGIVDAQGFSRGLGIAPGVSLTEQLYVGNYQGPEGMRLLIRESSENDADISTNSWGPSGSALGYDLNTMEVDLSVRDAQPAVAGNQNISYILAIANGNGGTQSQGTPDDAKNVLTVGSTYLRNFDGVLFVGSLIQSISFNSAHGPARDGRTLPLIVAPGRFVDSTHHTTGHSFLFGTSMATPAVAGGAALYIERYRDLTNQQGQQADPSPEMIKAALVGTTDDLLGGDDADGAPLSARPNSQQGWGRMNLDRLMVPDAEVLTFDRVRTFQQTGENWVLPFVVDDPNEEVRVVLAWTDAAGHGLGGETPAWNNNLDLEVAVGADSYLGNVLDANGFSITGGSADPANNLEAVMLSGFSGGFTVNIKATDLNSDGVPGVGGETDQDFALFCYNCREGVYPALTGNPIDVANCGNDSIAVTIQTQGVGGYDQALTMSVQGLPVEVTTSFDVNPVNPGDATQLTLSGLNQIPKGDYIVMVEADGGDLQATHTFTLRITEPLNNPSSLVQPLPGDSGIPLSPNFSWLATEGAETYRFVISTQPDLSNPIEDVVLAQTTHELLKPLAYNTPYYWQVYAQSGCLDDLPSGIATFTTWEVPTVLLVDDDRNQPDVQSIYTDLLTFLKVSFDVYDTGSGNVDPRLEDFQNYDLVIWFTGDHGTQTAGGAGPSPTVELDLATYLAGGGQLLMTSQGYFTNLHEGGEPNAFMQNQLGMASGFIDMAFGSAVGAGILGDLPVMDILPPGYPNRTDLIGPGETAQSLMVNGDPGSAGESVAILKDTGAYKAITLGFGIESLNLANRRVAMGALLDIAGYDITGVCRNAETFFERLEQWPSLSILDLATCLNALNLGEE